MKHTSDKRLLSKMYKELNSKKMNNLIKKWAKDLNRHLTKAYIQISIVSKHMKRYSTSYVIREFSS